MRMRQLFSQTLREVPAEAEIPSHMLSLKAGLVRSLAAGIYSYLPLGRRALNKIENIIREEIDAIGGQEITMPVVHPADIWKETQRWYKVGDEMARFKDRADRDMVLAMTHEEVIADLVRQEIQSYRQLPCLLYQIQTKFRDEPRSRGGLIRVREFTMKDSYSLDADWEGLDQQYQAHYQAYFNIFNRCHLPVIAVESDVGMMGGQMAHEYMYLNPIGEDTLVLCDACGYSANRQVTLVKKAKPVPEALLPIEKVATPGTATIDDLAAFLDVSTQQTAKAVFLMATLVHEGREEEKFVFAVVRGDMDLNETKLANAIGATALRPAHEEDIRAVGAEPGYASPIGLELTNALVVVDDLIPDCPNLVAGANEAGYHFRNTNYGRDYETEPHLVKDIVAAQDGDLCPECSQPVRTSRGVEVGNIFKLGTEYTEALGGHYLDSDGNQKPVIMGCYGIGSGRLLACALEEHHDENGICFPISIAPYQVHLVAMLHRAPEVAETAERIYREAWDAGIEMLLDDREATPGVKFNDADLLGLPIRLTIGPRSLKQGAVEFKLRTEAEARSIPLDDVIPTLQTEIERLLKESKDKAVPMPFPET
ncbi:proline--tRNA ligase [Candidatus Entotheonella palauensis]|uniref:proline--tRNA ligase n=1 Tax=Candidatus Entotheonella palauensis TaxID=93172 RepID=UPI000B7FE9B9|nr:proline--tRNA ligase [Candidatus Entotheonella palauensis]